MKLYTFYTESHKLFLDNYFLPSFQKTNKNISIEIKKFDQYCKSGEYEKDGWYDMMLKKINYILYSIEQTWGDYFIHADCDIQFFDSMDDLKTNIEDYDILAQDDGDTICNGFFVCKSNENTKKLFTEVKKLMNIKYNDQITLNKIKDKYIKYKLLDQRYYSIYRYTNKKVWTPDINLSNLKLDNIIMHHANWTVGIKNKIKLLDKIKQIKNDI